MGKPNPEYHKLYREENAERIRSYQRAWYLKMRQDPEFLLRLKRNDRALRERLKASRPPPTPRVKTWTKERQREYHRGWSARNRERINEKNRKYSENNRDKVRARIAKLNATKGKEYSRRYRLKNPEKRREVQRRYWLANVERIRSRLSAYSKTPRGRALINGRATKRRALKKLAMPVWANTEAIEAFYAEATRLTLTTGTQYDVDHVVPLQGKSVCGLHVEYNLQILHHVENVRKGNRLMEVA
jgi:hypothetical protein